NSPPPYTKKGAKQDAATLSANRQPSSPHPATDSYTPSSDGRSTESATPLLAEPEPLTELGCGPQSWEQALHDYQQQRPAMAAVFEHVQCRLFSEQRVELILNSHQQRAISSSDRAQFQQWLKRSVTWHKEQSSTPTIETVSAARERQHRERQQQLWQQAQANPHIQQLQTQLQCQLLAVDESPS
ncbi:MAG: hypothetical protein Q9M13_04050, partial [Mariprofundales bacterium]|nr:hypothetical protein [Mariprofundales bacterium]